MLPSQMVHLNMLYLTMFPSQMVQVKMVCLSNDTFKHVSLPQWYSLKWFRSQKVYVIHVSL